MDKPNSLGSVVPFSGHYSCKADLRLNAWFMVATVVYLVGFALIRKFPDWPVSLRALVALAPLIPSLLYARAWWRFTKGMDELQRRVQIEAFLFAAIGTLVMSIIVNTLNAQGATLAIVPHGFGVFETIAAMLTLWAVGVAVANCRYK